MSWRRDEALAAAGPVAVARNSLMLLASWPASLVILAMASETLVPAPSRAVEMSLPTLSAHEVTASQPSVASPARPVAAVDS